MKTAKLLPALLGLCVASLQAGTPADSKPASAATQAAQARARAALPADDGQDAAFATRGFIATLKDPLIRSADGALVRNVAEFDWVQGAAPAEVHPSLWRQLGLFRHHGLFKVADGVWQVRGLDISNMLVIRGKTGWIIVDPLMTVETAAAAMQLVTTHLGEQPVSAVIYSHSHHDHFDGVRAVVPPGAKPAILAPEHFIEETISESVLAGPAMSRRVSYQIAIPLAVGPRGNLGGGIMPTTARGGTVSLLPPTDTIRKTGETRVIDGVRFEFQMVPDSEAPSEMNFFLPDQRVLYIAEMCSCVMHNFQTPRGALVRDANKWAGYITEAIDLYGARSNALATGHCWPRFGTAAISEYLNLQRDNYKFIHDQTIRRMNQGETPLEIAHALQRPAALTNQWSNRDYYGTVKHNAKGVFQRYIGWWDGIPAHLDAYAPIDKGQRFVRAMGGSVRVLDEARRVMREGDYRWAAEMLNDLVFAEPANADAQRLLADSYEQLGYQAESAIWRNIYLTGAAELRGVKPEHLALASADVVAAMPTAAMLDLVAVRLNPERIADRTMTIQLEWTDRDERAVLQLRNGVLVPQLGRTAASPTIRLRGSQAQLLGLLVRKLPVPQLEARGLRLDGDRVALQALLDALEVPQSDYSIVTP